MVEISVVRVDGRYEVRYNKQLVFERPEYRDAYHGAVAMKSLLHAQGEERVLLFVDGQQLAVCT